MASEIGSGDACRDVCGNLIAIRGEGVKGSIRQVKRFRFWEGAIPKPNTKRPFDFRFLGLN